MQWPLKQQCRVHDIYGIYVHSHTYLCTTCTLKVPNVYSCISKFTPGNPPDLWDNEGDVVSFDQMNWMMWCTIGWLVWREWPVLPPWTPASKSVEFRLPCSMGGVLFCMTSCQGITSGIYCFFGGHRVATNGKRGTVEPVGTRPCVWCFTASIVRSSKIWHEAGDYNPPRRSQKSIFNGEFPPFSSTTQAAAISMLGLDG